MINFFKKILKVKQYLEPVPFDPPVFLVGCMRSGTTFLANFAAEHPEMIRLESELNEVWTKMGGIDCTTNRKYADRSDISPLVTANMTSYFERCKLEFTSSRYYYWRLVNRIKRGTGGVRKSKEKTLLLNKSVHLINRLDYIMNMFPTAKIIFIIRPIEQQVNSLKLHFEKNRAKGSFIKVPKNEKDSWITTKKQGESNWTVADLACKWIQLNKTALRDLQKNDAHRYLILDYDKMVHNPKQILAEIYSFLQIAPLEIQVENTLEDRKAFNTNTSGNPVNAWKLGLTDEDLRVIEKVKNDFAKDFQEVESARLRS